MVVLVTGCASGFGKLIAVSAARAGHTVYAGVRDPARADGLREATRGLPVHVLALDVVVEAQREEAVARVVREQGHLDALVNNAGIALAGVQEKVRTEELRKLFEVNVFGPHALTRAALPYLRDSKGLVLNVTSMAGRQALPGVGAYAGSKFALEGMTEALRHELRDLGVRVVLVEPGPYKTDIFSRNRWVAEDMERDPGPYAELVSRVERFLEKREPSMGDPQEVADLVVRLLTEPRPKMRYPLGPGVRARLALRSALPFELYEAVLARVLRG